MNAHLGEGASNALPPRNCPSSPATDFSIRSLNFPGCEPHFSSPPLPSLSSSLLNRGRLGKPSSSMHEYVQRSPDLHLRTSFERQMLSFSTRCSPWPGPAFN